MDAALRQGKPPRLHASTPLAKGRLPLYGATRVARSLMCVCVCVCVLMTQHFLPRPSLPFTTPLLTLTTTTTTTTTTIIPLSIHLSVYLSISHQSFHLPILLAFTFRRIFLLGVFILTSRFAHPPPLAPYPSPLTAPPPTLTFRPGAPHVICLKYFPAALLSLSKFRLTSVS
ncbi:hypothetical protein E2C01_091422 [Portunus trituberculatus]|uniref:Uncharacterized protein n=1 Tax=Portunus trituberculatus TaxID=210409 RepID=A0A5B7JHG5_PORTR|nr:hypothetical protein [Portunus trituberculatus]